MPASASTVYEVRGTGDDTNGGGFVTGAAGTDRSLQNAAQVNIDNSNITCTSTSGGNQITFAGGSSPYTATSADVGNIVQISGGVNTVVGFYQITAQTSTTWTLAGTSNVNNGGGAGSAITGKMGGALISIGMASAAMTVTGQTCYIKYDATHPILVTVITASVTGGTATASNKRTWVGYDSTRTLLNTDANRPVIQTAAGLAAHTVLTGSGNAATVVRNLIIDAETNWATSSVTTGVVLDATCTCHNCKFLSCVAGTSNGMISSCESNGGTRAGTTGFTSVVCVVASVAHGCVTGFNTNGGKASDCLAYSNTTGFTTAGGTTANLFTHCTSANNSGDGFGSNGTSCLALGCTSDSNGGTGFNNTMIAVSCYANKNTSADYGASVTKLGTCVTGASGSTALTNTGSLDFSLNATAGQGALGRAALAATNALPGGIGAGYADIGAIQHQDTGGGAAGMLFIPGLDGL